MGKYFPVDRTQTLPSSFHLCLPNPPLLPTTPLCQPQWLQGEVVELCARLDPVSSSSSPCHPGPSHQPPMTACSLLTNPPFLWYSLCQFSHSLFVIFIFLLLSIFLELRCVLSSLFLSGLLFLGPFFFFSPFLSLFLLFCYLLSWAGFFFPFYV